MNINGTKNMTVIAEQIMAASRAKQDYLVQASQLRLVARKTEVRVTAPEFDAEADQTFQRQLASQIGVPFRYWSKMQTEAPELLQDNANLWLERETNTRMIRTLNRNHYEKPLARAYLSDAYQRIDNDFVANTALGAIMESAGDMEIICSNLGTSKLTIQAKFPKIEGEVKVGDAVQGGFVLRNGECGDAAISVTPIIYRLVCLNGMIAGKTFGNNGYRRHHIGSRIEMEEGKEFYKLDTIEADLNATALKVRDHIEFLSDPKWFQDALVTLRAAADSKELANPIKAVEKIGKPFNLDQTEQLTVLEALIKSQDYSKWGMANALTALANGVNSYERSVELQQAGGNVIDLSPKQWEEIAEAA